MDFIYHILDLHKFSRNANISKKFALAAQYAETLAEIEKSNQIDLNIYKYAVQRNSECKTNNIDFEQRVKELQIKRKRYFRSLYYPALRF